MTEQTPGDADRRLTDYIAAVASAEPTPGGGSVVATVAALAAGLCEMVCNLTVGRPAHAADEPALRTVLTHATDLRIRAEQLAREDEAAYRRYIVATTLPKSTDQEKLARREALQTALTGAADAPLTVAATCINILELLETAARLGNKHVLSDAEVGALLAAAALHGALVNARINIRLLKSPDDVTALTERADTLEHHGQAAAKRVHTALATRAS